MQYASFWLMLPYDLPYEIYTADLNASSSSKSTCHKCGARWHHLKNFDAPADIQATCKKHKQYMESMESHYVEECEEYEEEPEAYDVNLCIDDFQDPKRPKTQEHETGDFE